MTLEPKENKPKPGAVNRRQVLDVTTSHAWQLSSAQLSSAQLRVIYTMYDMSQFILCVLAQLSLGQITSMYT